MSLCLLDYMSYKLGTFFDSIIGTLEPNTITTLFGPPGSGKSTLCFEYCVNVSKQGKKVIFIDTEGGFSSQRIKQIDPNCNLENILVYSPKSFSQQQKIILSLNKEIKNANHIGLIVVDSLVMLYRLKLGESPQKINKELGEQLRMLTEISRTYSIPIIVTNQMYKSFDTKESKMVGGLTIEYWSKTIVEFIVEQSQRKIKLVKHKSRPASEEIDIEIVEQGVRKKTPKSFLFFNK